MKKILISILFLFLLCAGTYLVWSTFFGETPEKQVKRTFAEFSDSLRKSGTEGMIVTLEKSKTASKFFDDVCSLKLDKIPNGNGAMNRQNIASNTLMLRNYFASMSVRFYDLEIQIRPDATEAFVTFTAVFEGNPSSSGRSVKETKEMDAGLVKKDGRWLFKSLAFRDVIRK